MNICLVIDRFKPYGAERVARTLADEFARSGHTVTVVTYSAGVPWPGVPGVTHVSIAAGGSRVSRLFKALLRLRRIIARSDVAISFMPLANTLCGLASMGTSVVIVGSEHNVTHGVGGEQHTRRDRGLRSFIRRRAYSRMNALVCVSEDVARSVKHELGAGAPRIETIYNPFDFDAIKHLSEKEESLVVPIPSQIPILMPAALKAAKNHEFAFRLLSSLDERYGLVLAGDGPLREFLEKLAVELRIDDRVTFLGVVENPYRLMKQYKRVLIPSVYEGFGLTVVEAAYLGCAVYPSDVLGLGEISRFCGVEPIRLCTQDFADRIKRESSSRIDFEAFAELEKGAVAKKYLQTFRTLVQP